MKFYGNEINAPPPLPYQPHSAVSWSSSVVRRPVGRRLLDSAATWRGSCRTARATDDCSSSALHATRPAWRAAVAAPAAPQSSASSSDRRSCPPLYRRKSLKQNETRAVGNSHTAGQLPRANVKRLPTIPGIFHHPTNIRMVASNLLMFYSHLTNRLHSF